MALVLLLLPQLLLLEELLATQRLRALLVLLLQPDEVAAQSGLSRHVDDGASGGGTNVRFLPGLEAVVITTGRVRVFYLGSPSCSDASSSSSSLPLYSYSVSSERRKECRFGRYLHGNSSLKSETGPPNPALLQGLTLLPPLLFGAVDVVFELDADLPLVGLVPDERVFEQLLGGGALGVVLHQAALDEAEELL